MPLPSESAMLWVIARSVPKFHRRGLRPDTELERYWPTGRFGMSRTSARRRTRGAKRRKDTSMSSRADAASKRSKLSKGCRTKTSCDSSVMIDATAGPSRSEVLLSRGSRRESGLATRCSR
jgi:hypothetical protein